jgi:hypothetical protein
VLRAGDLGDFGAVLPAAYFETDGERHAYLVGFGEARDDQRVFHATSRDGVAWSIDEADPFASLGLELSPPGPIPGTVLPKGDGTWVMYLWGVPAPASEGSAIWRATAPGPGGPWTADREPALEPGASGTWDDRGLDFPNVVRDSGGWLMLYSASSSADREASAIGMATSSDGVAWKRASANPVITAELCGDPVNQAAGPRLNRLSDGSLAVVWLAGREVRIARTGDSHAWTCATDQPILDSSAISGSEGIHTIAATVIGGEITLLVESLVRRDGAIGSELWLADLRRRPDVASPAREIEVGPLAAGTYSMASFTPRVEVTVPGQGWQAFHHEPRFWDVARETDQGALALMFQAPTLVYGPDGPAPATAPAQAVELLRTNPGVVAGEPVSIVVDGQSGLTIDLVTTAEDTQLLAGERGLLGMGPTTDVRLAFFEVDGALLAIGLVAPRGTLSSAAAEVQPLLDSVRIGR